MPSQDELAPIKNIVGNTESISRLVEMLETPAGIIPFVGAGLSVPFGYPGWSKFLIDQAKSAGIEEKIREHLAAGEYEEAAEALLTEQQSFDFNNAIEYTFGPNKLEGQELTGAVSYLPKLAAGPVITTNFDHVLEEVFERADRPFEEKIRGSREVDLGTKALHENRRFLVKIHGDAWSSSGRVLTKSDYEREYGSVGGSGINFGLPLPDLLRQMLVGRPLLFLGCSLNQDRTVALLKQLSKDFRHIPAFAVVEQPTAIEEFNKRSKFLADLQIRRIWYPSGQRDLIEPLLRELTNRTVFSQGVITRHGFESLRTMLEQQQEMQKQQQDEINTLSFLVSHFVTKYELMHLRNLTANKPFPFRKSETPPSFIEELRRLRSLGLIASVRGKTLHKLKMQERANVEDYLFITERGKEYLGLRDRVDSKISAQNDDS